MNENLNKSNLDDTNEFVLNTEKQETSQVDIFNEINNIDFSNPDVIVDYDKYFPILENRKKEQEYKKIIDAENNIKKYVHYIEEESLKRIESKYTNLVNFLKKYDVEKSDILKLERNEVDKIYAVGNILNVNLTEELNKMLFNIAFTDQELKFIITALNDEISYNGNDILNLIEFKINYIEVWKELRKNTPKNIPQIIIDIDIRNVIILYSCLSIYGVKGMNDKFLTFATILNKLKEVNDLFNSYSIKKERINNDFILWSTSLEGKELVKSPEIIQAQQVNND
jgi:hypothetical protein